MSLLHDAKVHCDRFPSIAIDTGTEERSTIHLLTRMLNSMSSSCEYSGTQAVATALNLPAQFTMHKKVFLFSDQAIEYVRDTVLRINNPDLQNTDQPSETSSFSSGIYSRTASEANSVSSDSEHDESAVLQCAQPVMPSTGEVHSAGSQPEVPALEIPARSAVPALTEDQEFGSCSANADLQISDTDSDVDVATNQRVENLLRRGGTQHGSIPLMHNSSGKLCVVTQAEDYHFRSKELADYSLYEMVCTTYRRGIQRKSKDKSSSESGSESDEQVAAEAPQRRAGRQNTKLFPFEESHQLKLTHAIALSRKFSVAHFIRKVPPYPGPRPDPLTDAWKTRARSFAEFALVVFKPWLGPNGLPLSTTWLSFCEWMRELRQSRTILDRSRAAFVLNCAHNLKFSSGVSKILKQFRGSAATRWLEMAAHLRPRKWMFGDETTVEKKLV